MRLPAVVLIALASLGLSAAAQEPGPPRLFPPEELGVLESPDRDDWQQPDRVMDALAIADGSHVADVGAGGGWFTVRLARRVGPNGRVFAQDIQPRMIDAIERRVRDQQLRNVTTILGTASDPMLPSGLQAVLLVDMYPQLADPVAFLRSIATTLAPGGRIGIVDFKRDGAGGPGPPLPERVDPETVRRHATVAGLELRAEETFLRYQFLLVFSRR